MNPFLGVFFHWLGGLAAGSFYVPYKGVKKWAWEVYWAVGGFFSWIIAPLLLASVMTHDVAGVLRQQSWTTLWWTYFFGTMWGIGGLTFGLTMRYLGMSLGMGVALGYCAAFGTLVPPLAKSFMPGIPVESSFGDILSTTPGRITLAGVAICLLGIFIAALAGLTKEREMVDEEKTKAIAEFDFTRGLVVATFSGIMSACFAFALTAGNPIAETSKAAGTMAIWSGLPKLVVVLLGGFTTNIIWCLILNVRNGTGHQYFTDTERGAVMRPATNAQAERTPLAGTERVPVLRNYLLSALAGTTWYLQFFFYTMGETQMGKFGFASWTLHMASIIIFSTLWGWILHEWKGSSRKAHGLMAAGIATLILSTIVIGWGTWLKTK